MQQLLINPAFQAGVAPFLVALIAALVLNRLGWVWVGLAVMGGFVTTVALVTDITFSPLNSTRKIILLGLLATGVGLIREWLPLKDRFVSAVLFVVAAAAALWVVWPVVSRQEWLGIVLMGGGGALYVGAVTAMFDDLRTQTERAASAALAFGFGTGAAALLGASAFLGQLGIALGASAAAVLFIFLIQRGGKVGATLTLPVGLTGALLGFAASVYAQLPWYALVALLFVPVLARVPLASITPRWPRALVIVVLTAIPAALAVLVTWSQTGPPPF